MGMSIFSSEKHYFRALAGVTISKFEPPTFEKSLKIDLNAGSISLDSSQHKSISKPDPLQNISNDLKIIADL